jgi:hypothetical protein
MAHETEICQTEIPTILDKLGYKHTYCQDFLSTKKFLSYIFVKT